VDGADASDWFAEVPQVPFVGVGDGGIALKLAPTVLAVLMVVVQVDAVPLHEPDQPAKV